MKAIKIHDIHWNLSSVDEYLKEDVRNSLPKNMAFKVEDDFNPIEKIPQRLKKKFGYDVIDFGIMEIPIVNDIQGLLKLVAPAGKEKALFTESGNLSAFGKICKENLENAIKERIQLERKGTDPFKMPKRLDAMMLGIMNVTGLDWDNSTFEELMSAVNKKIWGIKAFYIKDAYDDVFDGELEANE